MASLTWCRSHAATISSASASVRAIGFSRKMLAPASAPRGWGDQEVRRDERNRSAGGAGLPQVQEGGPARLAQAEDVKLDVDLAGDARQAGVDAAAVALAAVVGDQGRVLEAGQRLRL